MKLGVKALKTIMVLGMATIVATGCSAPETTTDAQKETAEAENTQEIKTSETEEEEVSLFPATIIDSTGAQVIVEKEPERIVSLAPSTTEILYFLGEEENIVGRTDYCNYPTTILDVAAVGGTYEPNIETVLSLEPDLVVASTHTSQEVIEKLREVNIPVAFLNEQENVEGTYSAIELLGELTGEQIQAEIVIQDMKTRMDAINEKVAAVEELPTTYYVVGLGDSDFTAGGDTFIGELLRLADATNIAEDVSGWSISKEVIAESDPEIIILKEDPEKTTEQQIADLQAMEFYGDLTAIKEGNVYTINDDIISRQGPRNADALEILVEILHAEE